MHRRSLAIGLVGAVLLLTASTGSALGAILLTTLSREAAPPGAEVTLRIDMTGRDEGTEPGLLLLVPIGTHDEHTPCEQNAGATALADMTWRATDVEFEGTSYPGMASETRFTVPQVSNGAYYLAESWPDQYTRCFTYASFTVDNTLPDTAIDAEPSFMPTLASREPPTSKYPAAGICLGRQAGSVATFVVAVDTAQPRCGYVVPTQRLQIVNETAELIRVQFLGRWHQVAAHDTKLFSRELGEVWQLGVHAIPISYYAGGGPSAWLLDEDEVPDSAVAPMPSMPVSLIGVVLLLVAAWIVRLRGAAPTR